MKQVIKIIIIVITTFILYWNWLFDGLNTFIANTLAVKQLENTVDSSLWIQWYTSFNDNKFLIIIALVALLYTKEIKELIKRRQTNEEEI